MPNTNTQPHPEIIKAVVNAMPNYFTTTEKAMVKPLETAFAEWLNNKCPGLNKVAAFKAVEQNFIGDVMKSIEYKVGMRKNFMEHHPPDMTEKDLDVYWQLFENAVNNQIAMYNEQFAKTKKPDWLAKAMSLKIATQALLKDIRDPGKLSKLLNEEATKLYNEIKKLVPKK
jgi:hypothetical protein